jgi:hypothetical protein
MSDEIDEKPPTDDEFLWACWAGTNFLIDQRLKWERIARDESLMDGVRVFAAQRARAIREEMRPA